MLGAAASGPVDLKELAMHTPFQLCFPIASLITRCILSDQQYYNIKT
jgi:hypothetical protein